MGKLGFFRPTMMPSDYKMIHDDVGSSCFICLVLRLYEDAMNAPPGAPGPALNSAVPGAAAMLGRGPGGPRPPPPPAMAHHMPHHPAMQPNPYYNVTWRSVPPGGECGSDNIFGG